MDVPGFRMNFCSRVSNEDCVCTFFGAWMTLCAFIQKAIY